MIWRRSLALLLATAASALLVAAPAGAATSRTVSVSARAAVEVPRDSASAGFSVTKERRTRGAALRAASTRLRAVIRTVKRVPGVEAGDVRTGRVSIRKVGRGAKAVYRASQGISVTVHKAENAGELVSRALAAGATGVRGPWFFVGDREAAYTKALGAAFDKAKAKAETLASAAGATLGPALTIGEGEVSTIEAGGSFMESANGTTEATSEISTPPTKPGTERVTATVHVVFELL